MKHFKILFKHVFNLAYYYALSYALLHPQTPLYVRAAIGAFIIGTIIDRLDLIKDTVTTDQRVSKQQVDDYYNHLMISIRDVWFKVLEMKHDLKKNNHE